jgi:hypothetical protein
MRQKGENIRMYIENIKRHPVTCWTNYFGDVMLPGDTTGRDAKAKRSKDVPVAESKKNDSNEQLSLF